MVARTPGTVQRDTGWAFDVPGTGTVPVAGDGKRAAGKPAALS
jgi:hypothetical protein